MQPTPLQNIDPELWAAVAQAVSAQVIRITCASCGAEKQSLAKGAVKGIPTKWTGATKRSPNRTGAYCSNRCRQRAFRARKLAAKAALNG